MFFGYSPLSPPNVLPKTLPTHVGLYGYKASMHVSLTNTPSSPFRLLTAGVVDPSGLVAPPAPAFRVSLLATRSWRTRYNDRSAEMMSSRVIRRLHDISMKEVNMCRVIRAETACLPSSAQSSCFDEVPRCPNSTQTTETAQHDHSTS